MGERNGYPAGIGPPLPGVQPGARRTVDHVHAVAVAGQEAGGTVEALGARETPSGRRTAVAGDALGTDFATIGPAQPGP